MKPFFISLSLIIAATFGFSQYGTPSTITSLEDMPMSPQHASAQNLPHSQGKSFATLDDYLAHRKKMGMQDRPYYREVSPNRYKLEVGRGSAGRPAQYFTKQQLMEKYGFSR